MNLKQNIIFGGLLISSLTMAENVANIATSSSALSELRVASQETKSDKYFYLVDDFSNLATAPGFSFGAPSGLVPGFGTAFMGVAGTSYSGDTDGGLALGGGFGDPIKSVGGAASLSLGSIDPSDGGAGNRGSVNLSLGKTFTAYGLGAAVGVSNVDVWHATNDDKLDPSYYVAVTKLLPNDVAPVIITVGVGSNSYADISKDDIKTTRNERKNKWGEFVSGAVYVHPQMSLVLDYSSGITTFGTSIVPMPNYPVSIGLAAQDLFKEDKAVDEIKFLGTLSVGFVF
ncbi:MAG: hypothetical protein WBG30_02705 [Psychrilyobacter sp.]|uniref:hypothetical protein n=1 Tax=Psychrilyobacter sp. TaxID=2586924 RepID=UPI003C7265EF